MGFIGEDIKKKNTYIIFFIILPLFLIILIPLSSYFICHNLNNYIPANSSRDISKTIQTAILTYIYVTGDSELKFGTSTSVSTVETLLSNLQKAPTINGETYGPYLPPQYDLTNLYTKNRNGVRFGGCEIIVCSKTGNVAVVFSDKNKLTYVKNNIEFQNSIPIYQNYRSFYQYQDYIGLFALISCFILWIILVFSISALEIIRGFTFGTYIFCLVLTIFLVVACHALAIRSIYFISEYIPEHFVLYPIIIIYLIIIMGIHLGIKGIIHLVHINNHIQVRKLYARMAIFTGIFPVLAFFLLAVFIARPLH